MGRVRDAYRVKFRMLLARVNPRRLELGVQLLLERAERIAQRQAISLTQALARVYRRAQQQIERREALANRPRADSSQDPRAAEPDRAETPNDFEPIEFYCDAGLGGLARWLRAAGYEAYWTAGIHDDELLREARRTGAVLLTTDSLLMERGVLRDGFIPAVWVPPSLTKFEQLELVLGELRLPVRSPRCMSCGGELRRVDKESVRQRIPPRTYRWLDDYYVCSRCDKLFWHGSHWEKIGARLASLPGR